MKAWLASMKWSERDEPVCVSTSKRVALGYALTTLRIRHGTGPVSRGSAMCSTKITRGDIRLTELPMIAP